jgi:hypothetical protein
VQKKYEMFLQSMGSKLSLLSKSISIHLSKVQTTEGILRQFAGAKSLKPEANGRPRQK